MIKVRLIGGMGNQMFQFAFAYIISRKFSTTFVLDTWFEKFRLDAFKLQPPFSLFSYKLLYVLYTKIQKRLSFRKTISNIDCTVSLPEEAILNNAEYVGYFQDGSFYTIHEKELRKLFEVKDSYKKLFHKKYGSILYEFKILVVHVRAGDYRTTKLKEHGNADILLPISWYLDQLKSLSYRDFKCYVITDEIEYVKKEFEGLTKFEFVSDSMMNDFQLLQHADIAIISNSTFAWWASFLNVKPGARIIAPNFFLGYHVKTEFPAGIQHVNFEWR